MTDKITSAAAAETVDVSPQHGVLYDGSWRRGGSGGEDRLVEKLREQRRLVAAYGAYGHGRRVSGLLQGSDFLPNCGNLASGISLWMWVRCRHFISNDPEKWLIRAAAYHGMGIVR